MISSTEQPRSAAEHQGDLYVERMESTAALSDKEHQILEPLKELPQDARVLSIGAGGGGVERLLEKHRPDIQVTAIDNQRSMIEKMVAGQLQTAAETSHQENQATAHEKQSHLSVVLGDALTPPFGNHSFDAIVMSSVNHEIASALGYDFGIELIAYLQRNLALLKENGKLIIRDFAGPNDPTAETYLQVSSTADSAEINTPWPQYMSHAHVTTTTPEFSKQKLMNARQFLRRFAVTFPALPDDVAKLRHQLETNPDADTVTVTKRLLHEILLHFSWRDRFEYEVQERYSYLDVDSYVHLLNKLATNLGYQLQIEKADQYTQPGYPQHVSDHLVEVDANGEKQPFIPTTLSIVVSKTYAPENISKTE